jgi:uncharacterized protein YkwD
MFILLALVLHLSDDRLLREVPEWSKESYFRDKVYDEHDWESFYKLEAPQQKLDDESLDVHLLQAAVFFATNKMRESKGLKHLNFSPQLRDGAMHHSYMMVSKNFFSHINSRNTKWKAPHDRVKYFGFKPSKVGENLAEDFYSPVNTYIEFAEAMVVDWYKSPPHRAIMLDKQFSHLGVGLCSIPKQKGFGRIRITQKYATEIK